MDHMNDNTPAFNLKTLRKAFEMIKKQPYKPTMYSLVCQRCGRVYGQTAMGITMGNCGNH